MSQAENPDPLKTAFKAFTEIVGYPVVLVSYLLALSGRLPGPAPITTSIATVIITSLFVVGWRWREIKRQKDKPPGEARLIVPAGANPTKNSLLDSLFDPVKRSGRKNYRHSLARRRVESGILLGVTLFSVIWAGSHFQAALGEFGNPLLACSQPESKKILRILIADILETDTQSPLLVEERLFDFLSERQDEGQFEVCRWKEAIAVRTQAREVAVSNGANMLIWGRRDVLYEIHLEVPAWENPDRTISETSSDEASSVGFQITEAKHLGYLTEIAMSEIFF